MYTRYGQMLSIPARLPLPITPKKQNKKLRGKEKIKDRLELADSSSSPQSLAMPELWPFVIV
jgi:hypothetical protein